jgi:hypothetical protein
MTDLEDFTERAQALLNSLSEANVAAIEEARAKLSEDGLDAFLIIYHRESATPLGFLSNAATEMQSVIAQLALGSIVAELSHHIRAIRERAGNCSRNALAFKMQGEELNGAGQELKAKAYELIATTMEARIASLVQKLACNCELQAADQP